MPRPRKKAKPRYTDKQLAELVKATRRAIRPPSMPRPASKKVKPLTIKVWVGTEDGHPYLWSTGFTRAESRKYINETIAESLGIEVVRATLTLDPPPRKRPT